MSSNTTFRVGALDLGNFGDMGSSPKSSSDKPRFLNKPGTHQLKISSYEMIVTDRQKDGAGKQWGRLRINASDVGTGYQVTGFIDVPLESLVYTSKSGTTSKVKTQIFLDFIQSLTGNRPNPQGIAAVINGLSDLLDNGTFTGRVGYSGDYVSYEGKTDAGSAIYGLRLKKGDPIVSMDGDPLTFDSRDAAVEYYTTLRGFKPDTGVKIVGFNKPSATQE